MYRLLQQHTDESHALSTRQIMERMREEHGIRMHRTTLPKDVEILRAAGVEVMSERKGHCITISQTGLSLFQSYAF